MKHPQINKQTTPAEIDKVFDMNKLVMNQYITDITWDTINKSLLFATRRKTCSFIYIFIHIMLCICIHNTKWMKGFFFLPSSFVSFFLFNCCSLCRGSNGKKGKEWGRKKYIFSIVFCHQYQYLYARHIPPLICRWKWRKENFLSFFFLIFIRHEHAIV